MAKNLTSAAASNTAGGSELRETDKRTIALYAEQTRTREMARLSCEETS